MEKRLKSQKIYEGRIINVYKDEVLLHNGRRTVREVVEHKGAVACLPLVGKDEVLLVRQHRYPVKKELLEIPAGIIERRENAYGAVKRELLEETGYSSNNIEHMLDFYSSPGYSDEIIHLFFAYNLKKETPSLDFDERITIKLLPLDECINMVKEGKICDAKTIMALIIAKSKNVLGFI